MQTLTYNFDKRIEQSIMMLRQQKHLAGFPFMIEGKGELSLNQAYMEYPDGHIEIVEFSNDFRDYTSVRKLSNTEIAIIRSKYHLENA